MTQPPYPRPPIIEGVIALHFSTPVELKAIETFALRRKAHFPVVEDMVEMSASFIPHARVSASNMVKIGHKLISADGTRVILAMQRQFAIVQLAPYKDWDTLCKQAREEWDVLHRIIRHRNLSHVSTRYINRIDIPAEADQRIDLHKYFTVGLSLPSYAQAMTLQDFYVLSSLSDPSGKYRHTLQLASAPSPLIGRMSFTIDIDISTAEPVPRNEEEMWEFVNSLRKYKNDLFKSCITPETRELFK